jgi:hypothetical protein
MLDLLLLKPQSCTCRDLRLRFETLHQGHHCKKMQKVSKRAKNESV